MTGSDKAVRSATTLESEHDVGVLKVVASRESVAVRHLVIYAHLEAPLILEAGKAS
jgi:hypothetical protein